MKTTNLVNEKLELVTEISSLKMALKQKSQDEGATDKQVRQRLLSKFCLCYRFFDVLFQKQKIMQIVKFVFDIICSYTAIFHGTCLEMPL